MRFAGFCSFLIQYHCRGRVVLTLPQAIQSAWQQSIFHNHGGKNDNFFVVLYLQIYIHIHIHIYILIVDTMATRCDRMKTRDNCGIAQNIQILKYFNTDLTKA